MTTITRGPTVLGRLLTAEEKIRRMDLYISRLLGGLKRGRERRAALKEKNEELLTALKAVLEVTENGTCINHRHEREPVIENALAAVAKAEGGEE